jgi:hypothetical protein
VGDPDGGVRGVHALPAGPGGAEHVDPQVVRVDLDLAGLLRLGQHEDAGRGGVDPPGRLGHRDPLDAVDAALVLQPGEDPLALAGRAPALDRDRDVLEAAEIALGLVQHLGAPALALREAQVHPQQVAGEQRGLLTALAGLDLQDDVAIVVRVTRDQQAAQPLPALGLGVLQAGQLGAKPSSSSGELAARGEVVAGCPPGAQRLDDSGQLRVAAAESAREGGLGVHRRIGQPRSRSAYSASSGSHRAMSRSAGILGRHVVPPLLTAAKRGAGRAVVPKGRTTDRRQRSYWPPLFFP